MHGFFDVMTGCVQSCPQESLSVSLATPPMVQVGLTPLVPVVEATPLPKQVGLLWRRFAFVMVSIIDHAWIGSCVLPAVCLTWRHA